MARALKPAGALLALVVLALGPAVLPGHTFFQRDVHLMWYTQVETLVDAVGHGHWPLWNPYLAFGQPLWADANTQPLYPFTLLHLVLRPWTWYTLFVVAHLWLAGAGTAVLARRLGASIKAAFLAGALVSLGGPMLSLVSTWNQLAGAAWMPWTAACALGALRRPEKARIGAWAACLAAPVLAGSPEGLVMGAALTVACAWGRFGIATAPLARRSLSTATAAVLLGATLSAGQWLPALEASRRSARATLSDDARAHWSMMPALMIQTIVPAPLASLPLAPQARLRVFGGRDAFLASVYLGLPVVALLAAPLPRRQRRIRLALLTLGAAALLFSLGPRTPVYSWTTTLPGLSALRYPAKAMVLVGMCFALLAGLGLDGWRRARHLETRRPRLLALLLAATAIAAMLGAASAWRARPEVWAPVLSLGPGVSLHSALIPLTQALAMLATACVAMAFSLLWSLRSRTWGRVALVWVPVLDLLGAHRGLNPTAPVALFTHRPPLLDVLGKGRDPRVLAYDYFQPGASEHHLGRTVPYLPVRGPAGWSLPAIQALGMREYLYPPVGGAWKLAGSFDQDVSGFGAARVSRLTAALYQEEARPDVVLRLLQIGAVTEVVALHERGWEPLLPVAKVDGLFPEPLRVFRVPDTLPRAYLARGRAATGAEDLRDLVDPTFVPAQMVMIEGPLDPSLATDAAPRPGSTPIGTARVVESTAEGVSIDVEATEAAYLVTVDAFDPHWSATVDGAPVPVRRANTAFRAVPVGPGRHRVDMRYRPWPVFAGLGITLAGGALMAWLVGSDARRRRHHS